jgi:hypothetical protein
VELDRWYVVQGIFRSLDFVGEDWACDAMLSQTWSSPNAQVRNVLKIDLELMLEVSFTGFFFVQWEVDRNLRELFVTNPCKGNDPKPKTASDWPEWQFKDGYRKRIPGSFVHTVSQEAKCKTDGNAATESWTSDEIEVRIMLGQDPTNEDVGELQAACVNCCGSWAGCCERL